MTHDENSAARCPRILGADQSGPIQCVREAGHGPGCAATDEVAANLARRELAMRGDAER